ncbi:MAG TPA: DUF3800 domain-containing protein [Rhodanobacteraceae bacterium]
MLVLIDESGDAGFKVARGSTSHFVIALVAFADTKEAESASAKIAELRARCRVKPEFKFSKSSDLVRDTFFKGISSFSFTARALIVDKERIYSPHLRTRPDRCYNYFLSQLLANDGGLLRGAIVKLDGSGSRQFRHALNAYLRQQLRTGEIGQFKFADSRRDNLIQLADMVAGAILRSCRADDRARPSRWRQMLQRAGRLRDVWEFR